MSKWVDQGAIRISGAARRWLLIGCVAAGLGMGPLAHAVEYSREFQEKIAPATEAFKSKAWSSALAKAKDALTVAKGNTEKQLALKIIMQSAMQSGDLATAENAAEQLMSMDMPQADKLAVLQTLQYVYFTQKRYDRALPITKQIIAATGGSPKDYEMLFASYQALRDCPNGLQTLEKMTKGRQLKQDEAKWQIRCYYDAKDTPHMMAALEAYNLRFQDKEMFLQLLTQYRLANPPLDDLATLDMERLGTPRDFLTTKETALDYAQRALDSGAAAEADRILTKAVERKWLVVDPKAQKLVNEAKHDATEDKKNLEQNERESSAGKNGDKDFQVGTVEYALGDFAKAAEAFRRALQPEHVARVKRVDQANMMLGMSLARLKKYEEAEKAFLAAKADPRMSKVATVWLAWLRS